MEELTAGPQSQEELLVSSGLRELRSFIEHENPRIHGSGFLVMSSENSLVVAAKDDTAIGGTNSSLQRSRPLQGVFAGTSCFVPPIRLQEGSSPTMLLAAAVRGAQGNVIAILAELRDPTQTFSSLCQLGRIGTTGETYAFDASGNMLSESRFNDELQSVGLIEARQSSILTVLLADPGRDLTQKAMPTAVLQTWPLTFAVRSAIEEGDGSSPSPYRDYRGVEVYGAWIWNRQLGIGLVTEIDATAAQGSYALTRTVSIVVHTT